MLSPRQGWTGSPHSFLFPMERKKKGVGGPFAVRLSNPLLPQEKKKKRSEKQSEVSVTPAADGGCNAAAVKPKVEQL